MKDLRFKIIAEHVQAGWDRAKSSLADLKGKLSDFFGGAKAGWAGVAGAIAASVAGIYKFFDGIRDKWVENLKEMDAASIDFADQTMDNLRRIKFQDTEQERARNVDNIKKQINEKIKQLESVETDDLFENAFENAADYWQGKIRGIQGFDESDDEARKMARLNQEIKSLRNQLRIAEGKGTKEREAEEKAVADAAKKAAEEKRAADKARHDQGKAFAAEEEASLQKMFAAEAKLAEKKKEQLGMRMEVQNAFRAAKFELADPDEKRRMDMARLRELGQTFRGRDGFGNFNATDEERKGAAMEAIDIRKRMAQEDSAAKAAAKAATDSERQAQEEARRASAGQSIGIDDLFTRMYGQSIEQDPMLKEAKEQTKTLHQIERKLGMTA